MMKMLGKKPWLNLILIVGYLVLDTSAFAPPRNGVANRIHQQSNGRRAAPHESSLTPPFRHRRSSQQTWRIYEKGRDDDDDSDDIVGGGVGNPDQWGDDDENDDSEGELGILDRLKAWFRSDEGREDVQIYLTSIVVSLMIRFFLIEPRYIPSLSMYPTFDVGDQLAVEKVTKLVRPYQRKQVVVFNPPQAFRDAIGDTSSKSKEALIKRIVAIAGDKVKVTGGKLYVNGDAQEEPFISEDASYEFGPVIVPTGSVLVLGDNRNHSLDGHIWGFLPEENVIGRAVFVYWPPWRLGNNNLF